MCILYKNYTWFNDLICCITATYFVDILVLSIICLYILTAIYLLVFLRWIIERRAKLTIFKLEKIDSSETIFLEFLGNEDIIYYDDDNYDYLPATPKIKTNLPIHIIFWVAHRHYLHSWISIHGTKIKVF